MKYYIAGFVFALSLLLSCDNDESNTYNVGSDFLEDETNITVIDTFSVHSSTFKINPTTTSSEEKILLGHIENELGPLTASSFMELSRSSFSIDNSAEFDSIGFVLKYDNYYYGDTTVTQNYKIYQLDELVRSPNDDDEFYNSNVLSYTNLLGEVNVNPRPNDEYRDSIYIPLESSIGKDLFDKIQEGQIASEDEFLSQFKGIAIEPEITNSSIIGFLANSSEDSIDNSSLRMYYTIESDTDDEEDNEDEPTYIDFVVLDDTKQFNNIYYENQLASSDYPSLSTISVSNNESVSSTDTDKKTFIQSGTGISTKLEIPGIKEIKSTFEYKTTLEAELTINPSAGTFNKNFPLSENLSVYIINANNDIIETLTDIDGNIVTPILTNNSEFSDDNFYTIDVTNFVKTILDSEFDLDYGLMLQYEDYNQRVDRIILDDASATNSQLKFTVKYLNF